MTASLTDQAPPATGGVGTLRHPDVQAQLEAALLDLEEVLAVYPYSAAMTACGHCVETDEIRLLGRLPEAIPDAVLARFAAKSLITWGSVDDFKRLVPEMLRRSFDGRLAVPEPLLGTRLRRADWLSWPAAETPAVHRVLHAAWACQLAVPPGPGQTPVVNRLGLILNAENEIDTYLEMWEDRLEAPGDPAIRLHSVLHLADLLAPFAEGRWRRLHQAFPLARRGVVDQLDRWLRQPAVVQRVTHASEVLRSTPQGPVMDRGREGMARLRTGS